MINKVSTTGFRPAGDSRPEETAGSGPPSPVLTIKPDDDAGGDGGVGAITTEEGRQILKMLDEGATDSGTLRVNQNGNLETDRYELVIKEDEALVKDKQTGKWIRIYGDPHVDTGDGDYADFHEHNMTIMLEDGTKLTFVPTRVDDKGVSFIDQVVVTHGDEVAVIDGIHDGKAGVLLRSSEEGGLAADAAVADGATLTQKTGGELDDLFFSDRTEMIGGSASNRHMLDARAEAAQAPDYEQLPADYSGDIDTRLDELESDLKEAKDFSQSVLDHAHFKTGWLKWAEFYAERREIVARDQGELQARRQEVKTREEKIALYNLYAKTIQIELAYNVDIRSGVDEDGGRKDWSSAELDDLEKTLGKLPDRMVLLDSKKATAFVRDHAPEAERRPSEDHSHGVGGGNVISNNEIHIYDLAWNDTWRLGDRGVTPPDEVILHEIGHNHEDENPQWKKFKELSGWREEVVDMIKHKPGDTLTIDGQQYVISPRRKVLYSSAERVWVSRIDAAFGLTDTSTYGRTNPLEDFAETFTQFFNAPQLLKDNAPAKYQFMVEYSGIDPLAPSS